MGDKVDHHKSDQPCELSHQVIKQITNDFDDERIVGRGGFGIVYKGIHNEEEIAVKVLINMSGFDCKGFQKEFENLRKLKHENVVQLKAFCNESEEVVVPYNGEYVTAKRMHTALCLEYVRNGTLAKHISVDGCSGLNWHVKYKIIKAICEGLQYLRRGSEQPIWHLDLKPENILLDDNMIPKITDFGLSKLIGDENTKKTMKREGTLGYMPPEYIDGGFISEKFDIFSLGVIIAKLMAGSDGYSKIIDMPEKMFIKHVLDNWRKKLGETLEPRPLKVYCKQVRICIEIALKCMKPARQERPPIEVIISNLAETEIMIDSLRLQTEQFRDGESILPKEGIAGNFLSKALNWHKKQGGNGNTGPSELVADSRRGKTEEVKASTTTAEPKELPLEYLKKITNDFSGERVLGKSSSGWLYKGILEDGEVIAVKKLPAGFPSVPSGISFADNVRRIAALEHENILKLVGFCCGTDKKVVQKNGSYITGDIVETLLCYEYCGPKGSLEKNLFEVPHKMDWQTRFQIIRGICGGLRFVHENQMVHMDLKPGSILLDNNMQPKIADFNLARLFGSEQTRICTQTLCGPYGYMAPEYLYRGEISSQSDIYSLGLLILEITTERNTIVNDQPSSRTYVDNVAKKWTRQYIMLKYSRLDSERLEHVNICIEIGMKCLEIDRRKRPSIEKIVEVLNSMAAQVSNPVNP